VSPTVLFWLLVGVPLMLLALAFPIVRSPYFIKYGDLYWLTAQNDLFEAHNRPCDVLIYGDSTAMSGLDPAIISRATGLSTCNIASTGGVLAVMGLEPLDEYLSRNPRPKFLVLNFAPGSFRPPPFSKVPSNNDGYIQLIRHGSWTRVMSEMVQYPDSFVGLMHWVYHVGATNIWLHITGHKSPGSEGTQGSYIIHHVPGLKSCAPYYGAKEIPQASRVAWFREHFDPRADHLLIDVAPVSPCNALFPQWERALSGATDNKLEIYPSDLFVDGNLHLARAGAERLSRETASEILIVEAHDRNPVVAGPAVGFGDNAAKSSK
jgi:hypothetical protein